MHATISEDPILARFGAEVRAAYGERLDRIVLFGSRARGDHRADSDYDVAVFVHDADGLSGELDTLIPITTDILLDTGAYISPIPFDAGHGAGASRLMRAIREEGRIVEVG